MVRIIRKTIKVLSYTCLVLLCLHFLIVKGLGAMFSDDLLIVHILPLAVCGFLEAGCDLKQEKNSTVKTLSVVAMLLLSVMAGHAVVLLQSGENATIVACGYAPLLAVVGSWKITLLLPEVSEPKRRNRLRFRRVLLCLLLFAVVFTAVVAAGSGSSLWETVTAALRSGYLALYGLPVMLAGDLILWFCSQAKPEEK